MTGLRTEARFVAVFLEAADGLGEAAKAAGAGAALALAWSAATLDGAEATAGVALGLALGAAAAATAALPLGGAILGDGTAREAGSLVRTGVAVAAAARCLAEEGLATYR